MPLPLCVCKITYESTTPLENKKRLIGLKKKNKIKQK